MNRPLETNDRRMPYELSEAAFEALHARIGRRLDAADADRPGLRRAVAARPLLRWGAVAAGAAVVVAGVVLALRLHRPADGRSDFDGLLSTASAETLQQAAAENYDDILFNQQL